MCLLACWVLAPHPSWQVFGAGTCLDTSRFQTLIAQSMDLDPKNVHGRLPGTDCLSIDISSGLSNGMEAVGMMTLMFLEWRAL